MRGHSQDGVRSTLAMIEYIQKAKAFFFGTFFCCRLDKRKCRMKVLDKKDRRQAEVKGITQGEKGLAGHRASRDEVPFPLVK
ncbi:MAG: hypothetical protein QHH74_04330 [Spirochaetota bacterium]|nr:hypothetical protein [Spirochaetota bacterium]